MQPGSHDISLRLGPSTTLDFREAAVFFSSIADRHPQRVRYDNNNSSALAYSTGWSIASAKGVPNDTATIPYRTTSSREASMSFAFRDAVAVEVSGMLDAESGRYSVNLDGNDFVYLPAVSAVSPDATLFFQTGLDPSKEYELTLTNKDENNGVLSLNSVTLLELPSPPTDPRESPSPEPDGDVNPHMPTGNLVAIILGSILGVLIFTAVVFGLWKRRRTANRPWAAVFFRGSSLSQTLSDDHDALARQRAHSSFYYQTDRRHSFPQSGIGTEVNGGISDPFATPAPSANHSTADLLLAPSSASVRTEVVVTNDRTGATVMLWSPSDRFLASASTPSPNGHEPESFRSMMRRPMSGSPTMSTPPLSDSSPSSIRPLLPPPSPYSSSIFPPESSRRRSIVKKPLLRQLPPLPAPRAPLPSASADSECPLSELDAGRVDESYFDRSHAGPPILRMRRSSSPPPKYER